MGKFLGFSDKHYYFVANVRIFSTGYIPSHYHLVFDDLFEIVICTRDYESFFNAICNYMF